MNNKKIYNFLVKDLMPKVSKYLERLIRLKSLPNLSINPFYSECYESRFSKTFDYRGGLGILITSSLYGEEDPGYVAFSMICKQDPVSGRPLLGQLNFNPTELNPS